jgi:hypothetical protein
MATSPNKPLVAGSNPAATCAFSPIKLQTDKLSSGATPSGFGGQGIDKPSERGYTLVPSWNPSGNKTEVKEVKNS